MLFKILLIFVALIATSTLSQAERVATYKEYKILDAPHKFAGRSDNADVEFYLKTIERLEKLQEEAVEIRDLYKEMVETMFGLKLKKLSTEKSDVVGTPRKAAEDWVRSSLNFGVLN